MDKRVVGISRATLFFNTVLLKYDVGYVRLRDLMGQRISTRANFLTSEPWDSLQKIPF